MKFYTTEQIIDENLDTLFIKVDDLFSYLQIEQNRLFVLTNKFLNFKPRNIEKLNEYNTSKVIQGIALIKGRLSLIEETIKQMQKSELDHHVFKYKLEHEEL